MGGGAVLRNLRASGSARLDAGPCRHAAGNASCKDRTPAGAVGHGIFLNSNLETWSPRARLPVPNRRWQASDAAFSVLLAECWPDAPAAWQPARTAISHAQAAGSHTRRSNLSGTPNGTGCDADGGLAPHSVRGRSLVGGRRSFAARWLLLRISPLGRIRAARVKGAVAGSRRAAVYVQRGPRALPQRGMWAAGSARGCPPPQRIPRSACPVPLIRRAKTRARARPPPEAVFTRGPQAALRRSSVAIRGRPSALRRARRSGPLRRGVFQSQQSHDGSVLPCLAGWHMRCF